ncbi:MAG: hypothetical protein AAGA56_13805, partial [Myxococcota bacterium]
SDLCTCTENDVANPNWDPLELSYIMVYASSSHLVASKWRDAPSGATIDKAMAVYPLPKAAAVALSTKVGRGAGLTRVLLFGTGANIRRLRARMRNDHVSGLARPTALPRTNWIDNRGTKQCLKSTHRIVGKLLMFEETWLNFKK